VPDDTANIVLYNTVEIVPVDANAAVAECPPTPEEPREEETVAAELTRKKQRTRSRRRRPKEREERAESGATSPVFAYDDGSTSPISTDTKEPVTGGSEDAEAEATLAAPDRAKPVGSRFNRVRRWLRKRLNAAYSRAPAVVRLCCGVPQDFNQ